MHRKPQVKTDDIFRALADPVRRRILSDLNRAPQSVHALAGRYEASRPAISRHLKVLKKCRVIDCRPAGRENVYYLQTEPLREVFDWLEQFWGSRLAKLKTLSEGDME